MPRIRKAQSPLKDLLSALIGAQTGDHLVCEFSCSCCKPTISAAADALCTYLHSGPHDEVLTAFNRFGGPAAIEVALNSSNDLMVCAAVRVIGTLLQVAANSSRDSAQQPDQQQQQRQQQQQESVSFLQAERLATADQSDHSKLTQHSDQEVPWLDTLDNIQPGTGAQGNTGTTTTSTSNGSSCISDREMWYSLLQQIIDRVAGGSSSAAVRVAALRELEQLLLQFITQNDTVGPDLGVTAAEIGISSCSRTPSSSTARSDSTSTQLDALGTQARFYYDSDDLVLESGKTSNQDLCLLSLKQPVASVNQIDSKTDSKWLSAVMQSSLAAMQDSNQEVRRAGSKVLASALVLQDMNLSGLTGPRLTSSAVNSTLRD